jgi:dolichol-phosphate mannosyltransferase
MRGRSVSIVLPVFNEEENIALLTDELTCLFRALPYDLEIIIVDDGSAAPTAEILEEICERTPEAGVLHLTRNFGHQAALTAGIDAARGDAVIVMDADRQHPVSVLPELLRRWENGADIVYTIRESGARESVFKRASSRLFYKLLNLLSDTPIPANAADFRLMDRLAVDALCSMPERTRFLRGLSSWVGFRQEAVSFRPECRRAGTSKYSMVKMLRLALNGIASMSTMPLKLALLVGTAISLLSFLYLTYVVWAYFFTSRAIAGWSSLIVAMLFLGGLQINLIGVLGLYVGKVYEEVKQRPLYLVRRRSGHLQR